MSVERINPPTLFKPSGHTHITVASGRRTAFIAGQTAIGVDRKLVGKGDFPAQVRAAFANLTLALEAIDADYGNVVKMTAYSVHYVASRDGPPLGEIYLETVRPHKPAITVVAVEGLATPDLLFEVEAVASLD